MSIGALIVYDITDQDSFNKMSQWVKELRQQVGSELPIIVVGNKLDLNTERVVAREEAQSWCNANGDLPYYETCATEGTGLSDVFIKCGTQGIKDAKISAGGADDDLPTSLSGAAGAIKLDPSKEEEIRET